MHPAGRKIREAKQRRVAKRQVSCCRPALAKPVSKRGLRSKVTGMLDSEHQVADDNKAAGKLAASLQQKGLPSPKRQE